MLFIIQKEKGFHTLDIELEVLKQELNKQKFCHEYIIEDISFFDEKNLDSKFNIKEAIPVGSIEFVSKYLKNIHNIAQMNPIEIPDELRLEEFLGRRYSIRESNKLPKKGYYFIKDVSELKVFTYIGDMQYFHFEMFDESKTEDSLTFPIDTSLHLNPNHLFQVSEVVDILSEYRVLVFNDEIERIQFYDGNPMIMPTPDEIKKIQKMVLRYMLNKNRPRAYALDVAIIKTDSKDERELIVLESCPFTSLGTYGFVSSNLPYMYQAGIDWYINSNDSIKKFSNF